MNEIGKEKKTAEAKEDILKNALQQMRGRRTSGFVDVFEAVGTALKGAVRRNETPQVPLLPEEHSSPEAVAQMSATALVLPYQSLLPKSGLPAAVTISGNRWPSLPSARQALMSVIT